MNFFIVLLCTIAGVFLLATPLRKYPVLFYALAVLLNILYIVGVYTSSAWPALLKTALFVIMQRCTLSLALFVVVMYIGVFQKDSRVSQKLRPVRAELSILACILALGHMVVYLLAFAPRVINGAALEGNFIVFFATALILLALLLVLGVTSFKAVRLLMKASTWKNLQKLAYVFFGLIYVHLVSILLPPALAGAQVAQISIAVYTVLFGLYAVLRIRGSLRDKTQRLSH